PGSLGRRIFFPGSEAIAAILAHEEAHIRLGHRYDILVVRVLQCLFWPNIFLGLIGRELMLVHEFQADAAACSNRESYAELLLRQAFHPVSILPAHSFFHHPLKHRIIMLQQKSSRRSRQRIAITGLFSAVLFSFTALWAQQ